MSHSRDNIAYVALCYTANVSNLVIFPVFRHMTFDRITAAIVASLPGELPKDVRNNLRAALAAAFEKMNLVTREEMEIQEKVLLRTREKLDALSARLDQLEHDYPNGESGQED